MRKSSSLAALILGLFAAAAAAQTLLKAGEGRDHGPRAASVAPMNNDVSIPLTTGRKASGASA